MLLGRLPQNMIRTILRFLAYQFVSTFGAAMAVYVGLGVTFDVLSPLDHALFTQDNVRHLLKLPYFPLQIAGGFWFGWLLGRRSSIRSIASVWVLPLIILGVSFVFLPTVSSLNFGSRLSHFFGRSCRIDDLCIDDLCIDQIFTIMPLYSSLFFSMGGLLVQRRISHQMESAP